MPKALSLEHGQDAEVDGLAALALAESLATPFATTNAELHSTAIAVLRC